MKGTDLKRYEQRDSVFFRNEVVVLAESYWDDWDSD